MIVGLDVASRVRLQVGVLDSDVIAVRQTADAEEQRFAVTVRVGAIGVSDPNVEPRAVVPDRCDRRVECYGHALSEAFHKDSARFGILAVEKLIAPNDD